MNIESLAVTAVKDAISKTDYLVDNINMNDKEPSWDGSIYVYKVPGNNHKKEDYLATIPVQVKGKVIKDHSNDKISFRVQTSDLKNYRKIGGTLFFVVYISSDGTNKKIYYNSLLPFEINRLLKKAETKKSMGIDLCSFPTEKNEITNTVLNFARDMDKQGLLRNGEYDMERAAKEFDLSKFQYSFTYSGLGHKINHAADYVLTHDLYLYAHNEDHTVNIVVDHMMRADIVAETLNMEVGVAGKVYYSSYIIKHTRERKELHIGKSFVIKLGEESVGLTYKLSGNIQQRIIDMEFMIAMIENRHIYINSVKIPFHATEAEIESFHIDDAKKQLIHLKNIQEILCNLGIKQSLEIDNLTAKDDDFLKMLITAFKHNKPVPFKSNNLPPVAPVTIANLKILLAFKPTSDGKSYEVKDFFCEHFEVAGQDNKGKMFETSQYTILDEETFSSISNLNIPIVVKDLCAYHNDIHYSRANLCALEMIKAFDKTQNSNFVHAAEEIFEWLIENDSESKDLCTMNLYQCYIRERKLSFSEKAILYNLLDKYKGNSSMLAGLSILLDEKEEALNYIEMLSESEKLEFISYPICNLIDGIITN